MYNPFKRNKENKDEYGSCRDEDRHINNRRDILLNVSEKIRF